jgi:beta-galactosidase
MTRIRISLNGDWDFFPLDNPVFPDTLPAKPAWQKQKLRVPSSWRWSFNPSADYQPYDLFEYPSEWNEAQAGWIHRTFIPQSKAGMRIWLHFEAVLQRSVFYLNGKQVYASTESYLPIEFDVTDHLCAGINELAVWCGPYEQIQTPQGEKVLAPCGSWFSSLARGPWQDVWLEYIPAVSLSDLAVRTSVRRGEIEVEVTLENRTLTGFRGSLFLSVQDGEKNVLTFPVEPVELSLGVMTTLRLCANWKSPHCWSPEDPYLYQLEAALDQDGQTLDTRSLRFGFREVWLDGRKFMLNGTRVNLRGDAWHYQGFAMQTKTYALNWYRMCKEAGVNFVRLHAMPYPQFFLDAADEAGMLIVDESAIYGSGKAMQADHPAFLSNCHDHLRALVRRDRSHPSVIIWSMQNEMRWVDGRDGYSAAMPELTETIQALDPTRPVSYDGDNRLFPAERSQIISMHYNIDGTVASWDRSKPLIFGEHGAFHYVSPQVAARYGGPAAYLGFDEAMRALAWSERLFIQYARHEEVTGLTPFNLVNYTLRALPAATARLDPGDISAPGVHPLKLPEGSLTINNGMAPVPLVFVPTPAWRELADGFHPVTLFADEMDTQFFGGQALQRSFSVYNDTLYNQPVSLTWRWVLGEQSLGQSLGAGKVEFQQPAGERYPWSLELALPTVEKKTSLTLSLGLSHAGKQVFSAQFLYWIHPVAVEALKVPARVLFLGREADFSATALYLPQARRVERLADGDLGGVNVLVVGPDCPLRFEELAGQLEPFVRNGGSLLLLEQTRFLPGELVLADRSFPMVFINDSLHPVFDGLTSSDLRFWEKTNPWDPGAGGMTRGAFLKPAGGDVRILLEGGDGDFGWGGLLWSPLIEYAVGQGRVICSQMALRDFVESVPAARTLLRNLLAYACSAALRSLIKHAPALLVRRGKPEESFLAAVGIVSRNAAMTAGVLVLDPDGLSSERTDAVRTFLAAGGQVLVLPARPEHADTLRALAGVEVSIRAAPVYQLAPSGHELARGISVHDLDFLERVTYTPANHTNHLAAEYCLEIVGGQRLMENVHNPWEEFFVGGKDGEYQKISVATRIVRAEFERLGYGAVTPVGAGRLIFCQLLPEAGNPKALRVYARLLGNLGAELASGLFSTVRAARDYAIDTLMALPRESYQDLAALEAYFSDPGYTLNNLGEGVYGWMKRAERQNGAIAIPGSAGRTWFLSVFIDSDINRDPEKRVAGELPDSSIVPDLFLETNAACRVYVNGRRIYTAETSLEGAQKIEDVVLSRGINRLALVCAAGEQDLRLNLWLQNKYGDPVEGLHYRLTLD